MATTFRDLLNSINTRGIAKIATEAVSGFAKGLGIPFETSARSMSWLLQQARATRKATAEAVKSSGISTVEPRNVIGEATEGTLKTRSRTLTTKELAESKLPSAVINAPVHAGDMVMFIYDPKTKEKLPYYDTFPLVFPISLKEDGFLGINLHYLPPYHRALLMDELYTTLNNQAMDATTRLRINYEILKGAAQFKAFKPCIKRYLTSHIRSVKINVHPSQWDMVLTLPLARFVKADQLRVWNDSLDIIRGIKKRP